MKACKINEKKLRKAFGLYLDIAGTRLLGKTEVLILEDGRIYRWNKTPLETIKGEILGLTNSRKDLLWNCQINVLKEVKN
jgi:hypothetical protein